MKVLYFFQGSESLFNPFTPSAPFLYLLKTSENLTGDRERVHWERMNEKNKTMISFRLLVCTDLLRIYRDHKVYINWWYKVLRNFSLVLEFFFEWIRCASEKQNEKQCRLFKSALMKQNCTKVWNNSEIDASHACLSLLCPHVISGYGKILVAWYGLRCFIPC